MIVIFTGTYFINKQIIKANDKKIVNAMNELEKEKVEYVFVEINPSLVITIKNNTVTDVACLNEDCMSFYEDINVIGKSTDDSIDYLYNLAKDKGFDTSNGVLVKTNSKLSINNSDYIKVEYIDDTAKKELLAKIINSDRIENINEDYYAKLWDELKKDKDYDLIYDCQMNNRQLECYIKNEFESKISAEVSIGNLTDFVTSQQHLMRLFDKFNIKYKTTGIEGTDLFKVAVSEVFIDNQFCSVGSGAADTYQGENIVFPHDWDSDFFLALPIKKINLINLNYNKNELITMNNKSNGVTVNSNHIEDDWNKMRDAEIQDLLNQGYVKNSNYEVQPDSVDQRDDHYCKDELVDGILYPARACSFVRSCQ